MITITAGSITGNAPNLERIYRKMKDTPELGSELTALVSSYLSSGKRLTLILSREARAYFNEGTAFIHLTPHSKVYGVQSVDTDWLHPEEAAVCTIAHECTHIVDCIMKDGDVKEFLECPDDKFHNAIERRAIQGVAGLYHGENDWRSYYGLQIRENHTAAMPVAAALSERATPIEQVIHLIGLEAATISQVKALLDRYALDISEFGDEELLEALFPTGDLNPRDPEIVNFIMGLLAARGDPNLLYQALYILSKTNSHHLVMPEHLLTVGITGESLLAFNKACYPEDLILLNVPHYLASEIPDKYFDSSFLKCNPMIYLQLCSIGRLFFDDDLFSTFGVEQMLPIELQASDYEMFVSVLTTFAYILPDQVELWCDKNPELCERYISEPEKNYVAAILLPLMLKIAPSESPELVTSPAVRS